MSRPRRSRWLSIAEVAAQLVERYPTLAARPRKRQLEAARRLVRRVERRDDARLTKRAGRALYVSLDALAALLPLDSTRLDSIDATVADLHQRHRHLDRRVNRLNSKVRDLDQRQTKSEEIQAASTVAIAAVSDLIRLSSRS